jgi:hypothetical protein
LITPATLVQVREGRNGRMIAVEDDVQSICRELKQIDPSLGVDWNDREEYFRVFQMIDDDGRTKKHTVLTAQELTPEIVVRLRMLVHPDYDYSREVERKHDRADREKDHAFHERTGEGGERLYWAIRKDLGLKPRAFIPKDIS